MNRLRLSFVPLALTLLALGVGAFRIGKKSLWDDEGYSVGAAHLSLHRLFTLSHERDPHTGLYHLLLHFWITIGGDGEAWIRFLSTLFGAGVVPLFWLTAKRLFGSQVAGIATTAVVINGTFVAYLQEARPYALTLFLVCLGMWAFVRAVQENRTPAWALWGALAGLSLYGHPFALGVVGAEVLSLFALPMGVVTKRRLLVAATAFVCFFVPALVMWSTVKSDNILWVSRLSFGQVGAAAHFLTGHGGPGMTLIVAALIAMFVVGLVRFIHRHGRTADSWRMVLVALWAVFLPVGAVVVSVFKPMLVPRYLLPALPGVALVVVLAIFQTSDKRSRAVPAVVLALAAFVSVNTWFTHGQKDNWRDAVALVMHNPQAGDGIVTSATHRPVVEYYVKRDGGGGNRPPASISPVRGWNTHMPRVEPIMGASSPDAVARQVQPYRRVWIMTLVGTRLDPTIIRGVAQQFDSATLAGFDHRIVIRSYQNAD